MKRKNKAVIFDDDKDIEELHSRLSSEIPQRGSQSQNTDGATTFDSMPLSERTLTALKDQKLETPTEIQIAAIPHALAGRDILGAAKTGSGKTLAFVIPMLEKLFRERWSVDDGLGAIILTPTRELALQIFDVIRSVGKKHQFSAGLVTGGKKEFEEEQARIIRMNILVATPGRLLQHMEQTPGFETSQVQLLILDEADRILDMGFRHQLDAILEYLPPRQTLLFSATQTKSVKDLARLSLKDPEYLAVHDSDEDATPSQLKQTYIIVKLEDKLDTLFSFIRTHLKCKMIVFFSTCAQVRYVYECFRSLQPGIPLTALHGKIKQERRTIIYMDYLKRKYACLFCTDIAARGLDFPSVDWVVQVDAPEDTAMYIHRVGRTARYKAEGNSLLMLLPQEELIMKEIFETQHIPIKKLIMNPKQRISVSSHASALLVSQPETRQLAKKAFISYLKSLQLLPNGRDIHIQTLAIQEYATSLGLAIIPELPMVPKPGENGREVNREKKNVNRSLDKLKKQIKEAKELKKKLKEEQMNGSNNNTTKEIQKSDENEDDSSDDEDDLLQPKVTNTDNDINATDSEVMDTDIDISKATTTMTTLTSKQLQKKKEIKLKISADDVSKPMRLAGAKKIKFNEEGEEIDNAYDKLKQMKHINDLESAENDNDNNDDNSMNESVDGSNSKNDIKNKKMTKTSMNIQKTQQMIQHTQEIKARLDMSRKEDEEREKLRVKELHRLRRMKDKPDKAVSAEDEEEGEGGGVQLAYDSDQDENNDDSDDDQDEDSYSSHQNSDNDNDDDDNSDNDSDDEDNSDDDSEDDVMISPPSKKQKRQTRTKGDDDNDNDDDIDIKDQEQLALKLLNSR